MSDEGKTPSSDAPPSQRQKIVRELLGDLSSFPVARVADRWERPMIHERALPVFIRDRLPSTIELERWTHGFEVHERELPPEIYADLRELTPQALLRDLDRPETTFFVEMELREGTQVRGLLDEQLAFVRAARTLDPRPVVEPSVRAVAAERERRRAFANEPWQPIRPDTADRGKSEPAPGAPAEELPRHPGLKTYLSD